MGVVAKKIAILFLILLLAVLAWRVFLPYIKSMTEETLAKRISVETLSNDPRPLALSLSTTTLNVELVVSESERRRGLGGRRFLDEDAAMLFVFEEPGYQSIWMKDMLFAIDIAWLDEKFRVVDIKSNVSPSTYPKSFSPDLPALYVLETNAGLFESRGITIGDTLKLVEKNNL
jgi:uncharacterized membrane protein (UPF0127 family)